MFIPSLFLGGTLGAVITLILGMSAPAVIVGAFVGACIAWVVFDPKQIVREVPRAFRGAVDTVKTASPKFGGWVVDATLFVLRPRLPLYVLIAAVYAVHRSRFWEWSEMAWTIGMTIIGFHGLVAWWVTAAAGNGDSGGEKTGPLMQQLGVPKYGDFVMSLLYHTVFGADWTWPEIQQQLVDTMRFVVAPYVIAIEWAVCIVIIASAIVVALTVAFPVLMVTIVIGAIVFLCIAAWKLFVLVHSEKRRMVFVDSGLGVLVGYSAMRWQFGATFAESSPLVQLSFVGLSGGCAVLLGVMNYHIIAKRALKLNPV